jgi:hypothetical protein
LKRRSHVGRLERELEVLRETIAQTEAERDKQIELAEQAAAERREAAHDPAAFGEAAARAAQHRDERDGLGFVLDRHAKDRARLERELEHARFEDAIQALEAAGKRRHDAARHLTTALAAGIEALPALEAARDEFDTTRARARELCPEDVEFELPQNADEPESPNGLDRLLELVQAGPRRPLAKTTAAIEQTRRQGEQSVRSVGYQAAREAIVDGDFERLGRIRPEERRAAVAAAEGLARSVPTNEAAAKVAQRRLERIRELVAAAEQVEAAV